MIVIDLLNKLASGEITTDTKVLFDGKTMTIDNLICSYILDKERLNTNVEILESDAEKINKIVEPLLWYRKKCEEDYKKDCEKVGSIMNIISYKRNFYFYKFGIYPNKIVMDYNSTLLLRNFFSIEESEKTIYGMEIKIDNTIKSPEQIRIYYSEN